MCGISGVQLMPGKAVSKKLLKKMGRKLQHRGPDNFSIFIKGNVGFANNRLSIIDLTSSGNQPFKNERYVLVYNGEIYNYLYLKEILLKKDVKFKSTSDTEVLFYHLIHFGVNKTLKALKGMFAFCFYDFKNKIVYLCRDRIGIKPLLWTYTKEGLFWASEVKAIAEATKIEVDPMKALFSAANIGDKSNDYTVFKNVKSVKPGNYLVCKQGKLPKSVEYYNINDEIDEKYYNKLNDMSSDEIVELFTSILAKSVKRMLMSDAPIGAFVSGGIDSSLISALAVQKNPNLSLFTANVIGKHSEYKDTKLLSKSLNKPLFDFKFSPEMMITEWASATYFHECPIVTHINAIPFLMVAKLARRKNVKAVLTGEAADELFLGYQRLFFKKYYNIVVFPIEFVKSFYKLFPRMRKFFPESPDLNEFLKVLIEEFEPQRLREEEENAFSFLPKNKIDDHYLTIQELRVGLIAILQRNDRMGMGASIESRFPFLDEEMIHFAVNLPLKFKRRITHRIHDQQHPFMMDKWIVRKAAEKYLPKKLVYKKKSGFPMYGHKNIRVKNGYFMGGYIAKILNMSPEVEDYMLRTQNPYFIAKIVSVDIFGRIFSLEQTPEEVTKHLLKYVTVKTN